MTRRITGWGHLAAGEVKLRESKAHTDIPPLQFRAFYLKLRKENPSIADMEIARQMIEQFHANVKKPEYIARRIQRYRKQGFLK